MILMTILWLKIRCDIVKFKNKFSILHKSKSPRSSLSQNFQHFYKFYSYHMNHILDAHFDNLPRVVCRVLQSLENVDSVDSFGSIARIRMLTHIPWKKPQKVNLNFSFFFLNQTILTTCSLSMMWSTSEVQFNFFQLKSRTDERKYFFLLFFFSLKYRRLLSV